MVTSRVLNGPFPDSLQNLTISHSATKLWVTFTPTVENLTIKLDSSKLQTLEFPENVDNLILIMNIYPSDLKNIRWPIGLKKLTVKSQQNTRLKNAPIPLESFIWNDIKIL